MFISSRVYGLKVGLGVLIWRAAMICEHELPTVQEILKNGIVTGADPSWNGASVDVVGGATVVVVVVVVVVEVGRCLRISFQ